LNLKRKRQGYGYFHWSEQVQSESTITEFLSWLASNTKIDEKLGRETHPWASIKMIERRTQLHHSTIKKAIDRLKEKKEIIEVYGKRKSRLFTLYDTVNADHIRMECKKDPNYRKWLEKINSKDVLKEPKKNRWGELVFPTVKSKGFEKRVLARERKQFGNDFKRSSDVFNAVKRKRHIISAKNRRLKKISSRQLIR